MDETLVFFRDDDARTLDPLRDVMQLFFDEQVPCSYQVIPDHLDPQTAAHLMEAKRAHPDLVFLNQHGLRHEQRIEGEQAWSEFAAGRPFEEQVKDIRAGRQTLVEQLGDAFDGDVFTPPCHKYDGATLRAMREVGFQTLSAGVRVRPLARLFYGLGRSLGRVYWLGRTVSYHGGRTPRTGLAEVSVCIDVDEELDARGVRIEKSSSDLWQEFQTARRYLKSVGVMLHHERYGSTARLQVLREFIHRLKADASVRIISLPEIARRAAGA